MPIEHSEHGGQTVTGDSIDYLMLCAQKGAVGLELKGIKVSRGPVLWKRCREYYKIPGTGKRNATHQQVYDWLCAKVKELQRQQEHIHKEGGREIRTVGGQEVQ